MGGNEPDRAPESGTGNESLDGMLRAYYRSGPRIAPESTRRKGLRFRVLGEMGSGERTSVIRVRDRDLDRDVALEVLAERVESASEEIRGFLAEAQVVAQLQHPGILPVLGLGFLEDGRPFVARRLADGETLATLLSRGKECRPRLLGIVEQAAQAMAYAHARGVAHGSLEASRVVRGAHGEVVVAGWERAARVNGDRGPVSRDVAGLVEMLTAVTGAAPSRPPRSSGEIVLTIGRHLGAAESRARTAELGAAKAASRAERERARHEAEQRRVEATSRSRRRVLATAAAVLLAVVLGGAGLLWKRSEDRQAEDRVEREIAAALREAERYEIAERWEEARAWARKAAALADDADSRAHRILAAADRHARIRSEDATLLDRLADIDEKTFWAGNATALSSAYEDAFRAAGLTLLDDEVGSAADSVRSRPSREALLLAIDRWACFLDPRRDEEQRHLLSITLAVDTDRWRQTLRRAADQTEYRRLTGTADLGRQPESVAMLLGGHLARAEPSPGTAGFAAEAQRRHPGSTALALLAADLELGRLGQGRWRFDMARALRGEGLGIAPSLAAATARRPDDERLWLRCGLMASDSTTAVRSLRRALDLKPESVTARTALALVLCCRAGDPEAARKHVESALASNPESAAAHSCAGHLRLVHLDDAEAAETSFRFLARLRPDDPGVRLLLARALRRQGRRDEERAALEEAHRIAPDSADGLHALGWLRIGEGRHAAALDPLRRSLEQRPDAAVCYSLGTALAFVGRGEDAAAALRRALEIAGDGQRPLRSQTCVNLGGLLFSSGRTEEALSAYRRAVALSPERAEPHLALGIALSATGRRDAAEAAYREAIERDPGNHAAHHNLGCLLFNFGRPGEAVKHLRMATTLDVPLDIPIASTGGLPISALPAERRGAAIARSEAQTLLHLGNALRAAGEGEEAVAVYRRATEVDPTLAAPHLMLSSWHGARGEHGPALASLRQALRIDPTDARTWFALATTLGQAGDCEQAAACWEKAVGRFPRDHAIQNGAAWFLATCSDERNRDPSRAVRLALNALQLEGSDGTYWNTYGVALYRAGQHADAIRALERSRAVLGASLLAHDGFFLAMAHARLGQATRARSWFDRSVDWMDRNTPEDPDLRRFRAEAEASLGLSARSEGR